MSKNTQEGAGNAQNPKDEQRGEATPQIPIQEQFRRLRIYAEQSHRFMVEIFKATNAPDDTKDVAMWAYRLGQCRHAATEVMALFNRLLVVKPTEGEDGAAKPADGGGRKIPDGGEEQDNPPLGSPTGTATPPPPPAPSGEGEGMTSAEPPPPGAEGVSAEVPPPASEEPPKSNTNEPVQVDGEVSGESTASATATTAEPAASPTGGDSASAEPPPPASEQPPSNEETPPPPPPYTGESRRIDDDGSVHYAQPVRGVLRRQNPQLFMSASTGQVTTVA